MASVEEAIACLRRGDCAAARRIFENLVSGGESGFAVWLGLAYACAGDGDAPGALGAVERALALDSRDLRALVLKADLLDHRGDASAAAFYEAALKVAPPVGELPAELLSLVQRAHTAVLRYSRAFEAQLRGQLAGLATEVGPPSARFAQSIDLLSGKKQLYVPQPTLYHFPELPCVQFHPRERFPWLPQLERATASICADLLKVMASNNAFEPYLTADSTRPMLNRPALLGSPEWSAYYLWKDGEPVASHAAQCPHTMQALEQVPMARIPRRSPNVLFSLLLPGAHIPAHNGFINTRLIGHLPLVVPEGCSLRVGNETRDWVAGEAWLFDDTIEHEAWNRSDQTRVVLLFEVWRPELSQSEREHVRALFGAIERHRGGIDGWGI